LTGREFSFANDDARHQLRVLFNNQVSKFLSETYPEISWIPWLFPKLPHRFWQSSSNCRDFFLWLAEKNDFEWSKQENWYSLLSTQMILNGKGEGILRTYEGVLSRAMKKAFPEYEWREWMFEQRRGGVARGFWKDRKNRVAYFNWLREVLGIKDDSNDWYNVRFVDVCKLHGAGLLINVYNNSLQQFLSDMLPDDIDLKPWKFNQVPKAFWKDPKHHKLYAQWLGDILGFKTKACWKQLKIVDLYENHGRGLVDGYYDGSPSKFVYYVVLQQKEEREKEGNSFSEYEMKLKHSIATQEDLRCVTRKIEKVLCVEMPNDWLFVNVCGRRSQGTSSLGGKGSSLQEILLNLDLTLEQLLSQVYPSYAWRGMAR